jgi:hypothetical protein
MRWPSHAYTRPALQDYGEALGRWWAVLVIAVAQFHGALTGGIALGILRGLAVVPALWLLGPLAWPYLRLRLRHHRRIFRHPSVSMPPDDYRLPVWTLAGFAAMMAATCVVFQAFDYLQMPWLEFRLVGILLVLVAASWELWIFYALELERRHQQMSAAGLPPRAVSLLRRVEGRSSQVTRSREYH